MNTDNRMKPRGYTFLAFPVSWLEDRKIAKLPHDAMGVYTRLYLLAGRYNQGGALQDERGPLDVTDIAYLLRCNQGELEKAMQLLESHGLLAAGDAWRVLAFEDEQINLDERRAQTRARVAKHREKMRPPPESEEKHEQDLDTDTESESESESEEEKEKEKEKEVEVEVEVTRSNALHDNPIPEQQQPQQPLTPAAKLLINAAYEHDNNKETGYSKVIIRNNLPEYERFLNWRNERAREIDLKPWEYHNPGILLLCCDPELRNARIDQERERMKKAWDEHVRKYGTRIGSESWPSQLDSQP